MKRLTYLTIVALIISCVFDPADKLFHLKMPLFFACWATTFLSVIIKKKHIAIPFWMALYLFMLLLIPLLSVTYYILFIGNSPYDGFQYYKAILFITIIIVLYISNVQTMKPLCFVLSGLSFVIILIAIVTKNNPLIFSLLYELGDEYGFLQLGSRQYGSITFNTVFYKTSPMIAIAIAYFMFMSITINGKLKALYIFLATINIIAMYLAGTRNNIIVAVILPLIIFSILTKHSKTIIISIISLAIFVAFFSLGDVSSDMFDFAEKSNSIKIAYLSDYGTIFENPTKLIFGQGLGSYNFWTPLNKKTSITELTFLELFRNYGLLGGIALLALILYPFAMLNRKRNRLLFCLLIGYAFYLLMSFSNPFLFSSSGMIILATVLMQNHYARSNLRTYQRNLADG